MANKVVDVNESLPLAQNAALSLQHVFAMFGATVLVPFLTGMDPSIALLASGIGTLIFLLCTKGQVPAYLGSSFAFISPIIAVSAKWGLPYALGGTVVVGLFYALVAGIIALIGTNWLNKILPPVVIGAVIIVIGLHLAPTAVDMAFYNSVEVPLPETAEERVDLLTTANVTSVDLENNVAVVKQYDMKFAMVSLFTLAITVLVWVFAKGFIAVIPILIGIVAGYLFAYTQGLVDLSIVANAAWFRVPTFTLPKFGLGAIMTLLPVAFVTIAEHLGDVLVIGTIVGRDFYKKPGLHRTILGDGLATAAAGIFGGPPNTTYGENVGVLAITKVFSIRVIAGAAILAIFLGFFGKLGAVLQTIPSPVMGGISMVLFGIIASSGIRTLVESGIDFSHQRNLIISSVILVMGIGGASLPLFSNASWGPLSLETVALATIVGILLNLILPDQEKKKTQKDKKSEATA
ncbi:MAG: solute carrier family 23 protein [Bacillota bacterium]